MMKKNGFTLAEVLITLAIIGVVAVLTLPALMNNTGEQQYITGLKKGINTLTEAAKMNEAQDGWNYGDINATTALDKDIAGIDASYELNEATRTLGALLNKRVSINTATTKAVYGDGMDKVTIAKTEPTMEIFFNDGSAVYLGDFGTGREGEGSTDSLTYKEDGLPTGFVVVYDTNGRKGPNSMSNCEGVSFTDTEDSATPVKDCEDRAKRVIKDQFFVRLRGSVAVPEGAAANWAYAH